MQEDEDAMLSDTERLLARYHRIDPHAWVQIAVAPTNLARVSPGFVSQAAELAHQYGALMHTHLGETAEEASVFLAALGSRPLAAVSSRGWIGQKVSFAHGIHFTADEVRALGATKTGVVHCPSSNMRLGSGIADVEALRVAGAQVGLGADGGASNEASNMLLEVRMALLLQRVRGASAMSPRTALRLATAEGARALGRGDLGVLAPGMAADFIAVNVNRPELAGTQSDFEAALVLCAVPTVDMAVVGGQLRVSGGGLVNFDWVDATEAHNRQALRILSQSGLR